MMILKTKEGKIRMEQDLLGINDEISGNLEPKRSERLSQGGEE